MTDFESTSIGFQFEFGKLRIVRGGEPKTVLFASKQQSDDPSMKLVMVTVEILAGGYQTTTEVITGPICISSERLGAVTSYLSRFYRAVEDCRKDGRAVTCGRVRAKIEGRERDHEDMAAKKEAEEDEDSPYFVASEGWFDSVPQVNLGIQIRTIGDRGFHSYDLFYDNLPGRLRGLYRTIVDNLDTYLGPIVHEDCERGKRSDLRGLIALYALLAGNLALRNEADLDTVDNRKVSYKQSWGLLPKARPVELWQAIDGEKVMPAFWEAVAENRAIGNLKVGEATRFVTTLFPDTSHFPGRVKSPPDLLTQLIMQAAKKTLANARWKTAPNAPPPFTVAKRLASVWELRLSASDTKKMRISKPDAKDYEMFTDPKVAKKFLALCADLAIPKEAGDRDSAGETHASSACGQKPTTISGKGRRGENSAIPFAK
jgi:hypothetical protein